MRGAPLPGRSGQGRDYATDSTHSCYQYAAHRAWAGQYEISAHGVCNLRLRKDATVLLLVLHFMRDPLVTLSVAVAAIQRENGFLRLS